MVCVCLSVGGLLFFLAPEAGQHNKHNTVHHQHTTVFWMEGMAPICSLVEYNEVKVMGECENVEN